MFSPQELNLILQLANAVELKGLDAMSAVILLANKCQAALKEQADATKPMDQDTGSN